MTIAEAKRILKVKSDYALAQKLGVSRFAVSKWRQRNHHHLPKLRAEKLLAMD